MAEMNPLEKALQPINQYYMGLHEKAEKARGPEFGQVELTRSEARRRENEKTPEERLATIKRVGIDAYMELVGRRPR